MMPDREKVIKGLEQFKADFKPFCGNRADWERFDAGLALLKEQETEWEHLWDAPDGTFKGRCKKCGLGHFFIEGHDTQYKFCPECGRKVKWK